MNLALLQQSFWTLAAGTIATPSRELGAPFVRQEDAEKGGVEVESYAPFGDDNEGVAQRGVALGAYGSRVDGAAIGGTLAVEPAALFVSTPGFSDAARIGVYANMFLWRQIDGLREDFPKLAALLGDDAFCALAEAYLAAHPSRHPSLARLGEQLPQFLQLTALARADAADLAALEWARADVFEDADSATLAAPLDIDAPLALVPALRRLDLAYEVAAVWRALENGLPPPAATHAPQTLVVWRKEFNVFHVALADEEAAGLALVAAGEPLANVCELFAAHADPVHAAFTAIGSWFAEGWIAATEKAGTR